MSRNLDDVLVTLRELVVNTSGNERQLLRVAADLTEMSDWVAATGLPIGEAFVKAAEEATVTAGQYRAAMIQLQAFELMVMILAKKSNEGG